ncbi:MAG: glycoside hydrolase family 31 protein [Treponema sp.]|nr:glycoside hydrolase family 31 protein [Treponema sp.]
MPLFTRDGNRLIYQFDAEKLWAEPWGVNSLRIRSAKSAKMPGAAEDNEDWALLSPKPYVSEITINDDIAKIKNGKIELQITRYGVIKVFNDKGKLLLAEYMRIRKDITDSHTYSSLKIEAREFKPNIGGDFELTMRFESVSQDEKIYGMGQYQHPYLNLKGMELELAQRNTQASVPFAVSNLGYGFLWNNPAVGRVCFGRNITTWTAKSTKKLDYWVTAGDNPAEIIKTYASVTGTVPMMPDYAMGFWQCKLRYQTQEELLNIAKEYKKRELPISVIVVDFFHWPLQGEWKFDPVYWPNPDAMVRELKDMGIELMVSVWPTVDYKSENWNEMIENGYLIRTERGFRISLGVQGNTVYFDTTNPDARAYLWEKIKKNYYNKGIKIFWLDEAEPEYTVYDFDNYRYYLGPNIQIGNIYPVMYAKTLFDGMKAEGQEKIINLVRCAWAGSQHYGALVWSGDVYSSFESLRCQLPAGLNMGLAGIPWWTTDIGGFIGGNINDPHFHELFIRWFEWSCFCPVMRLHGDRAPKKPPIGMTGGALCSSGADNEVWSFSPEVYEICKKYLFLREKLKPYITIQMKEAHENGTPVMRPLFYDFPDDSAAWETEDEYMFGPDYLVAPVLYEGQTEREVYLPVDRSIEQTWTNMWTNETFNGGKRIIAAAPLETIPVFIRTKI